MNPELAFDSIESAHEFVVLVSKVALETKRDIDADINREMSSTASRRVEALQIVARKLGTLELHLTQTRRILNDLRSLRRLLFEERAMPVGPKPNAMPKAATSRTPSSETSHSGASPESRGTRESSVCATVRKRALSACRDPHAINPEATTAAPWYVRPDFKLTEERKPRETNYAFAQQR